MRHSRTAALVIALSFVASSAIAQDMVVKYEDLDLTSAKGQKTLERRIDAAAKAFCKVSGSHTGTRVNREEMSCIAQARKDARGQMTALIGKPELPEE